MTDYDFKSLNDKEFEILAADLLGARDGVRYERFRPGRDSGVDGRYFAASGQEVVLQCKHWATTPLERLVKHLLNSELPKVQKLKPQKYLLALSHSLSRTDKSKIAASFAPHLQSPSDVLGREDLNDLLSKHPDVERRHYKLWISSSTVLATLINKAIYDRSAFSAEEILRTAKLYVPTKNHDLAIAKLEKLGSVIITGPAGIGKTTLAEHLCLHYLKKGFALVRVADEIREAESVFEHEQEQVFYFDDFLGRNYLEALSGHEGAHIVQFIRRVASDRKKRFILTSRTTILNQGKLLLDVFQTNNLDRNEFEVTLQSFTEMDRARVLYNHLWHSHLSDEYIDRLYEEKRYKEVIRHRNYNPRLIRFITDGDRLAACKPADYWQHVRSLLENPTTVWQNPFESQTDDFGRALVLLVALNGRPIAEEDLAEAYSRFVADPANAVHYGKKDLMLNMKHLVGSLLSRGINSNSQATIDLFNPSIGDYVLRRYSGDAPTLRSGFACLRTPSSLNTLNDLAANDLVSAATSKAIYRHVIRCAVDQEFVGYSCEYIALAALALYPTPGGMSPRDETLLSILDFLLRSECPFFFEDVAQFVGIALESGIAAPAQVADFLCQACERNPVSDELTILGSIQQRLPEPLRKKVLPPVEAATVAYLQRSVHDEFPTDEVFGSVDPEHLEEAEDNLRKLIQEKSASYGVSLAAADIDGIVEAYEIERRAEGYFNQYEPDEDDERTSTAGYFHIDEIDDLFDRSQ